MFSQSSFTATEGQTFVVSLTTTSILETSISVFVELEDGTPCEYIYT